MSGEDSARPGLFLLGRLVAITINVDGNANAEVRKLTNAFERMDAVADRAGNGGMRNAFLQANLISRAYEFAGRQVLQFTQDLQQFYNESIQASAQLQQKVANSLSIKPELDASQVYRELSEMQTRIPQTSQQLADSLYDVFSSVNASQEQGLELVEKFGRAATAAVTDAKTIGTATIGVVNAYKTPIEEADHVLDLFFNTVAAGVVTGQELASNLGIVTQAGKNAGVEMDVLFASIAGVTKEGGNAAQNINNLANVFMKLPTKETAAGLHKIGIEVLDSQKNFRPFLDILTELDGKLSKMSQGARAQVLQNIFPDAQARTGLQTLLSQLDFVREQVDANADSAGAAARAYEVMGNTAATAALLEENAINSLKEAIGEQVTKNQVWRESIKITTEQINNQTAALRKEGSEAGQFAEDVTDAYAWIRAQAIPFTAFMVKTSEGALKSLLLLVTGIVTAVAWTVEQAVGTVTDSITGILNTTIKGINLVTDMARKIGPAAVLIPGGEVIQGLAKVDPISEFQGPGAFLGSDRLIANFRKTWGELRQIGDQLGKLSQEGEADRRRLAEAREQRQRARESSPILQAQIDSLGPRPDLHSDDAALRPSSEIAAQSRASLDNGRLSSEAGARVKAAKDKIVDKMLEGVDSELADRFVKMMNALRARGIQTRILEGYRTPEQQDDYYAQGRTKPGPIVTYATGKTGLHPRGLAIDFDVVGTVNAAVWSIVGEEARRAGLRWGGHFKKLFDPGHVQLAPGMARGKRGLDAEQETLDAARSEAVRKFLDRTRATSDSTPIDTPSADLSSFKITEHLSNAQRERQEMEQKYLGPGGEYEKLINRRENLAVEVENVWRQAIIDRGNREMDLTVELAMAEARLATLRAENADDQLVEQRRLLSVKNEQVDLETRLAQVQDEIATGPYNQSLRIQLALLEDIAEIRGRDEEAIIRQNRAQLELADQAIFHSEQVRASVLEHFAQQRSLSDSVADAFVSVADRVGDAVGRALGKIDDLFGGLFSNLARLAVNRIFMRILDAILPASGGGSQVALSHAGGASSGGGIFSNIGNLLTGLFRPSGGGSSSAGLSQFLTGGFAGGNPAQQILFGNGANQFASPALQSMLGLGLDAPASIVSGGSSTPARGVFGSITSAAASAATTGGFSLSGLAGSLGPLAPLAGLGLGTALGGGGGLSGILGGVGGLLLGGTLGSILTAGGLFGGTGILGGGALGIGGAGLGGGLGASLTTLLLNPFTIAAGGALLVGAYFLNRNRQRRQEEKIRDQLMGDSLTQLDQLVRAVRYDRMDGVQALAQADQIRASYVQQASQLRDSKTRRHALADVSRLDVKISELRAATNAQATRHEIADKLVPTFAGGGMMIPAAPAGLVPGPFRGDEYLARFGGNEVILNEPQWRPLTPALKALRVPGFASGGAGPFASTIGGSDSPLLAPIVVESYTFIDAAGMVRVGLRSRDNRQIIIQTVEADIVDNPDQIPQHVAEALGMRS